jgi:UTP--glucose-1-phosphate uridylyltransferase
MTKEIKTAVFPVAGLGTRFLPATKSMPKEMLIVVDKPLIQYAVEEAKSAGIEKFVFITSQGKTVIEDHFDRNHLLENALYNKGKDSEAQLLIDLAIPSGNAVFIRQHEPLGLGHAVYCASHFVKEENFCVLLPDDMVLSKKPCLKQMIDSYCEEDGNMAAVMKVDWQDVNKYGILDPIEQEGFKIKAKSLVEKPSKEDAPSQLAIIGRYILKKNIFEVLRNQKVGIGKEIQLTDAMLNMLDKIAFTGYLFQGRRFDCGTKQGWLEANLAFAFNQQDLKDHMLEITKKIQEGFYNAD